MIARTLVAAAAALTTTLSLAAGNVALMGTASQSSDYPSGEAKRAIDGNTSGNWFDGSIQHTHFDSNTGVGNGFAWWQVSLDQDYQVQNIVVWSRLDCCMDRGRDFTVTLLDDGVAVWSGVWSSTSTPNPSTSFAVGLVGDAVRVQLNRQDYLHMAEVQVWGDTPVVPEPGTWALMALGLGGLGLARKLRKD